jgi:hypothetical protein
MYGEKPIGPVVFAACDSKYFLEHAAPLIYSASEIGKKDVHVHVVNPTEEVLALAKVINDKTTQHVSYTYNDLEFGEEWTPEMIRAYYASLRFLVAPHLLNCCGAMLIVDVDCLIMQEFDYPTKPIGFFPRESLPGTVGWEAEGTKVAAGVVYYHIDAMEVAATVAEELSKLPLQWFNDQIALSKTFARVDNKNAFQYFDNQFMDWEFIEGTTIWTGKGPRKYDNPTYIAKKKEFAECLL